MIGDSKPSQFPQHLQRINLNDNVYYIFLQSFSAEFHTALASLWEETTMQKLAEIVEKIANLTSK